MVAERRGLHLQPQQVYTFQVAPILAAQLPPAQIAAVIATVYSPLPTGAASASVSRCMSPEN